MNDKVLLDQAQAAEQLGVSKRFLEIRRYVGDGPRFVKISSRCIRYRKADLDEWVETKLRASTSDMGGAGEA